MRARFGLLLLLGFSGAATGASLDCGSPKSRVERLVCADAVLSRFDDELADAYRDARRVGLPESEMSRQRRWLSDRDACPTADCLRGRYKERIGELRDFAEKAPPEYFVICDPPAKRLTIEEVLFSPAADAPESRGPAAGEQERPRAIHPRVKPSAMITVMGPPDHPYVVPAKSMRFQCWIGNSEFRMVIEPYIFNADLQGHCGAMPPAISATVLRNASQLLGRQRFAECEEGDWAIHRIQFDEALQSMLVFATLHRSGSAVNVERRFPLFSLPQKLEQVLPQKYPATR